MAFILATNPSAIAGEDQTPAVVAWPAQNVFTNGVGVMLWSPHGRVHYTADGSEPSDSSPFYREPIWIVTNTTLKALAFKNGQPLGEPLTQNYRIVPEDLERLGAPLPLIIVHTLGLKPKIRDRSPVWVTVLGSEGATNAWEGPTQFSGHAAFAIRGNSSSVRPKKPYRLEIQDSNGEDLEVSLLGMPKEADWILLPSYLDQTFARDILAYELWRELGYYAPRWRLVELFVIRDGRAFQPVDSRGGGDAHFNGWRPVRAA